MTIHLPTGYRQANPTDATAMTELVNIAEEGLPLYLWSNMAVEGQSPWDVGRERARRKSGEFSYKNTIVREEAGKVAALLVGYSLEDDLARWSGVYQHEAEQGAKNLSVALPKVMYVLILLFVAWQIISVYLSYFGRITEGLNRSRR